MTTLNDLTANYHDEDHNVVEPKVDNAHHHVLGCLDPDSEIGHQEALVLLQGDLLNIFYSDCPTVQSVTTAFDQPPLGVQLNLF